MPSSEVTITAVCTYKQVSVTFEVNGRVLSTKIYTYGDELTIPSDPVLADDENYSYTFVGWTDGDQTLTADQIEKTATTNRHFVATFQTEEIEKVTKSGWTKLRIAITLIKVALIFVALLIISIIVVIIVKKRRRSR
jgi:hypothetical protein